MDKIKDFLNSQIPPQVAAALLEKHGVEVKPGETFWEMLTRRALEFARSSPEWADVCRELGLVENGEQ